MLPTDSIVDAVDQQPERWADCKTPGARLHTVTRDVEASDGTQVTCGDSIVITERYDSRHRHCTAGSLLLCSPRSSVSVSVLRN